MAKQQDDRQILLFADVLPNGCGGFTVTPKKPKQEITAAEATRILCCARSTLLEILNTPSGQKIIRWRWLTDKRGKRMFDLDSVLQYREATKEE